MPRPVRWIAASYAAVMGGTIGWAYLDYRIRQHRRAERTYP